MKLPRLTEGQWEEMKKAAETKGVSIGQLLVNLFFGVSKPQAIRLARLKGRP